MNVKANLLGLASVILVVVGLSLLMTKMKSPAVEGVAIGCGCMFLYLMGVLVGQADARRKSGKREDDVAEK